METKRTAKKFVDVRGAIITGIVALILGILLFIAHQWLWGGLTLVLGAWITWHILTHVPTKDGHPTNRSDISQAETANHFQPLDWEPVKSAQDAEALLTSKLGDRGWHTVSGTVAISAPIQFVVAASDGTTKIVTAAGQIIADDGSETNEEGK
ncbi:hypothetical protein [Lacticaseibacillus hegangensis]|uniref:NfeD-like C-terminal domain-containing protein n=1 Tax=Lacticaseibacillus hegangensis TaxID=2486010 RepID=A0ABW4CV86_9LACO|nr:hypothetical protein [Lacticaseibacillus hegangensis]